MYVGTSDHGADVRVGGQLSRVSFLHHMVRNSVFRLDSKPFYPGNCLIGPLCSDCISWWQYKG